MKAGYFDGLWKISPEYTVSLAIDGFTFPAGSGVPVNVIATVTGEAGEPVIGLEASSFTARIDGLQQPAKNWVEAGAGEYWFEVDISALQAAGYYLSITCLKDHVHGTGWIRFEVE